MNDVRYPIEPLAAAMGESPASLGRLLGLSGSSWKDARDNGLSEKRADRYAVRAGFHPYEIWPEMAERHITEAAAEEARREAARQERRRAAARRYASKRRKDPEYRAAAAEYLRDYRSSDRAKAAAAAYRRAYYRENRDRELARQREYDRTVRAARRAERGSAA